MDIAYTFLVEMENNSIYNIEKKAHIETFHLDLESVRERKNSPRVQFCRGCGGAKEN